MNTTILKKGLVRIFGQNHEIIGCGFLIDDMHILTCAHVVIDALNLSPDQDVLTRELQVDFPHIESNSYLTASVVFLLPSQDQQPGDIAVLKVVDRIPKDAQPVRLVGFDDLWEHKFRSFGFPQSFNLGIWASGRILDTVGNGWLQIEDLKQTGYFIEKGFSGAAVWDEQLHAVIGMVVAGDSDERSRTAFVIPISQVVHLWPPLQDLLTITAVSSWRQFREACKQYSIGKIERMMKGRIIDEIVIPRPEYQKEIMRFLESDNTFLTIVGESGMGKTYLIYQMLRSFESLENKGFLLYLGTELEASETLVDTIERDLARYLKLPRNEILREMEPEIQTTHYQVIVLIDAVNENRDPYALIEQIDHLPAFNLPWIKILMTCRPHVWQHAMRRGLLSPSFYYTPEDGQETFLKLGKFTTDETRQAYEKYKGAFSCTGVDFDMMSGRFQNILGDPLLLRLISEIHEKKNFPKSASGLDINVVPDYVHSLQTKGAIAQHDIEFLIDEINPRVVDQHECLGSANNDDLLALPNGRQSVARLLNAGILIEDCLGIGNNAIPRIRYRYERFQDYFIGKELYDTSGFSEVPSK